MTAVVSQPVKLYMTSSYPKTLHYAAFKNLKETDRPFQSNILYDRRVLHGDTEELRRLAKESLRNGAVHDLEQLRKRRQELKEKLHGKSNDKQNGYHSWSNGDSPKSNDSLSSEKPHTGLISSHRSKNAATAQSNGVSRRRLKYGAGSHRRALANSLPPELFHEKNRPSRKDTPRFPRIDSKQTFKHESNEDSMIGVNMIQSPSVIKKLAKQQDKFQVPKVKPRLKTVDVATDDSDLQLRIKNRKSRSVAADTRSKDLRDQSSQTESESSSARVDSEAQVDYNDELLDDSGIDSVSGQLASGALHMATYELQKEEMFNPKEDDLERSTRVKSLLSQKESDEQEIKRLSNSIEKSKAEKMRLELESAKIEKERLKLLLRNIAANLIDGTIIPRSIKMLVQHGYFSPSTASPVQSPRRQPLVIKHAVEQTIQDDFIPWLIGKTVAIAQAEYVKLLSDDAYLSEALNRREDAINRIKETVGDSRKGRTRIIFESEFDLMK